MDTTTIPILIPLDVFHSCFLWAVIAGFILAFVLGFGMGANDVSNAFGTSVGSKVLTLRNAYILASIVETAGAILVGYNVTDTMRKSVVDLGLYNNTPSELLLGQVAILGGGSCWLILATILKAPVSTTHSIMGATLGFTLLMRGTKGIHYVKVLKIALSWVLSPLLSGAASIVLYMVVDFTVLRRRNPLKCGFRMLPLFYFFCIAFNTFAISYQGSKILGLSDIPFYFAFSLSITSGLLAALIFHFIVAPRLVRWLQDENEVTTPSNRTNIMRLSVVSPSESGGLTTNSTAINALSNQELSYDGGKLPAKKKMSNERAQYFHLSPKGIVSWFLPYSHRKEDHKTLRLFSSIQVFTACFAGFAHGANDVSNAIAPLTALISVYNDMDVQQAGQTPLYILFYGVIGICCGLWLFGHRVIKTVGQRMSEINPASGFSIEFGAAMTTLIASKLGLPISTTHCLVGSVVGVGMVKAGEGVDWSIFVGIALSWVVTLPISGALAAAIMFLLKTLFL